MIKFENTEVLGWEAAIRGMRNPMNSWEKSDSCFGEDPCRCDYCDHLTWDCYDRKFNIGPNDLDLMRRLAAGGPVHAKYRRMITVYVDITAPLYWWKEFDTYKVGTVANSCSTMHKIGDKEFTLEDFSHEHLIDEWIECNRISSNGLKEMTRPKDILEKTIFALNVVRDKYIETSDELKRLQKSYIICALDAEEKSLKIRDLQKKKKQYWWQMIQLLPSSYNQKRTVMLNYEVLAHIYKDRKYHKLDEWREHEGEQIDITTAANLVSGDGRQHITEGVKEYYGFCDWIKTLPYAELICGEHINKEKTTPDCFVPIPEDK